VSLASLDDIRTHLAEDKLDVDDATAAPFQVDVERIIKAYLTGVFTATQFQTWDDPGTTPPLISSIAGRLIAAFIYREAYSEDESAVPPYAQLLYNEAIGMLKDIRRGGMVVLDANDVEITSTEGLSSADFWPNDKAPGPKFSMDREFA